MELLPSRTNTELFAVDFAVLLERCISQTQGEVISVMVGTEHKDRLKGSLWGRHTKLGQKCFVGTAHKDRLKCYGGDGKQR